MTGQFEWMDLDTDENEHSIEMHLPYIAKVMEKWVENSFINIFFFQVTLIFVWDITV